MKKCPFCAEEILEDAKKCRHCHEWLDGRKKDTGKSFTEDGSATARAISKGIKEKELADYRLNLGIFASLVISIIVGVASKSFWVGLIIFIIPIVFLAKAYYKE